MTVKLYWAGSKGLAQLLLSEKIMNLEEFQIAVSRVMCGDDEFNPQLAKFVMAEITSGESKFAQMILDCVVHMKLAQARGREMPNLAMMTVDKEVAEDFFERWKKSISHACN